MRYARTYERYFLQLKYIIFVLFKYSLVISQITSDRLRRSAAVLPAREIADLVDPCVK